MTALTYLFHQDGRYYFRRRVPQDLLVFTPKSENKISIGSGCSLKEAQSIVVYPTALHQDFFDRLRMTDIHLEEENNRLKGLIKEMMNGRNKRMMWAKKNRGNITLDLSTDIPLPKSLGGDPEDFIVSD